MPNRQQHAVPRPRNDRMDSISRMGRGRIEAEVKHDFMIESKTMNISNIAGSLSSLYSNHLEHLCLLLYREQQIVFEKFIDYTVV